MSEVTIEPTPLVWMGSYEDLPRDQSGYHAREIGQAYFINFDPFKSMMSNHYKDVVAAVRRPICVMCPGLSSDGRLYATPFWIDSHPSADPGAAWDVTVDLDSLVVGQKPLITVNPSIHLIGTWHGWLQDGVLHQ